DGETNLLAAYTCTPLVKIPVSMLKPGEKVRGATVAELGNRNRPLDMIVYRQDDRDFLLMANSSRGLMKISTDRIADIEEITQRVGDVAGLDYETIEGVTGVVQLDRMNEREALILKEDGDGGLQLQSVALP
ncbi:MAG: hypothetical protein KDA61_09530, partial [Planctomycetales bacterium]|nr:hypothetical protein [Planctomycetales bacterium]